jgi:hypothetical protein
VDLVPLDYCDACRTEWERRHQIELDRVAGETPAIAGAAPDSENGNLCGVRQDAPPVQRGPRAAASPWRGIPASGVRTALKPDDGKAALWATDGPMHRGNGPLVRSPNRRQATT